MSTDWGTDMGNVIEAGEGVLLVEDDPLIAWDINDQLAEFGFDKVYLAYNLAAAHECLKSNAILFAVLDVNLGNELVFPFAAALCDKGIPFVFCTAQCAEYLPSEWTQHPVISKPFDGRRFQRVLPALLG